MKTKLNWLLIFLIAATIGSYVRLYPLRAHIWSPSREQASLLAVYNIRQDLLTQIMRQSPDMPQAVAQQLAQEQLNNTLHTKSSAVRQSIELINTQLIKNSPTAQPIYLLESDPFYFYNLTQNIINRGHMADIVKGSKYFNPLMRAPSGDWQPLTIHPYLGFLVYKTASFFSPKITLMHAVGLTPIVISVFSLIPFLWVCHLLSCGLGASLGASIIFTLTPIYLKRSAFGWYDTDPYNLFFPLILLGILIGGLQSKNSNHSFKAGVYAGLAICLYALIWQGWAFIFFVVLASLIAVALFAQLIIKSRSLRYNSLAILACTISTAIISISFVFGFKEFFILIGEALGELHKFTDKGLDLWPSLFIGVGELKKTTAISYWGDIGGLIILGLGFGGFIYTVIQTIKNRNNNHASPWIILSVFLCATLLVTIGAERFSLFTLIPLSLFAAISLQHIYIKLPRIAAIIGLCVLILFSTTKGEGDVALVITPIYNSTWDQALKEIQSKTPPDSIINTWWPPGHFIKAISQRQVPFDGASLDEGAVGYWMSNILLSPDEAHAQGLLRMLNLSGNQATEYLTATCGLKLSQATAILHAIASKNKLEAKTLLKPFLNHEQIDHLLALTYAGHPHSYVLVYNELVEDNLILKFTGGWSFTKIETLNENPQLLQKIPKRNSPDFIDFLWDIAGGPSKYGPALGFLREQNNNLLFSEKLSINRLTMDATIDSVQYGNGNPQSVVYLENGRIKEHLNPKGTLGYSVLLYQIDGQYNARLMDQTLANSLIIKLFFFNGEGLQYFKPLS